MFILEFLVGNLLNILIIAGLLIVHLAIGTLYANKTSAYCYRKAHRCFNENSRDNAYNCMIAARVLAWEAVAPTVWLARIAKAPVETPKRRLLDADRDEITWRRAIETAHSTQDRDTAMALLQFAQDSRADAERMIKELESG